MEDTGYDCISERLIMEVQKRPALYNKCLQEFTDRAKKEQLWQEITENICTKWSELSTAEKAMKCKEVEKKWKNIKDNFRRELKFQNGPTDQGARKRRRYIYFNSLLFLLPSMEEHSEPSFILSNNDKPTKHTENTNSSEIEIKIPRTESTSSHKPRPVYRERFLKRTTPQMNAIRKERRLKDMLLQVLKERKEEMDEDKAFLLSLLPSLKKLDEEQKFVARIEILNAVKRVRFPESSHDGRHYSAQQCPSPPSDTPQYSRFSPSPDNLSHLEYMPSSPVDTKPCLPIIEKSFKQKSGKNDPLSFL